MIRKYVRESINQIIWSKKKRRKCIDLNAPSGCQLRINSVIVLRGNYIEFEDENNGI